MRLTLSWIASTVWSSCLFCLIQKCTHVCLVIRVKSVTHQCSYALDSWANDASFLIFYVFLSTESYFGDSFCTLQAFQDVSTFHLSLQIKTSRRSGLLLLAAGMEDYLFLELHNGKIQVNVSWHELFFASEWIETQSWTECGAIFRFSVCKINHTHPMIQK